jgi:hypothetical protein
MGDERVDGTSGQASGMTLAGEDSLLTGPSAWTAPRQRTSRENTGQSAPHEVVSVDHRDQTAIFDNAEFQQLRERLFGSAAISSYPVSLRNGDASDAVPDDPYSVPLQLPFPLQVEPPAGWYDDADLRPTERPASLGEEDSPTAGLAAPTAAAGAAGVVESPPDDPVFGDVPEPSAEEPAPARSSVDWASVSPDYAPDTEEREARGWVLTVLALVVVLAGIGSWLVFGGNDPRAPLSQSLPSTTGAPAAVGSIGLTSRANVTRNLMVVVTEHIVLDSATPSATLTIPDRTGTNATANYDPVVSDLEIVVGGEPVSGVEPNLAMGGSMTVSFDVPVREFTVTYRASGTVNLSKPSKRGRGLALVNAVTITVAEGLPATMTVRGPRILSLGCVAPGQPIDDCGTDDVGKWIYTGVVGDWVLAQVDLPPTG